METLLTFLGLFVAQLGLHYAQQWRYWRYVETAAKAIVESPHESTTDPAEAVRQAVVRQNLDRANAIAKKLDEQIKTGQVEARAAAARGADSFATGTMEVTTLDPDTGQPTSITRIGDDGKKQVTPLPPPPEKG